MRNEALILFVVAVAALPVAGAVDAVTLTAPEFEFRVEGTTIDIGHKTDKFTEGAPVSPEGEVVVNDVDVSTSGTSCTLYTDATANSAKRLCKPGDVSTPDATTLVDADIGLRFGSLEEVPASEEPAPLASAAAVAEAVAAGGAFMVAAAAGASLAGLYALWRLLKWTGLAAFLPLYSHISDDEILDDPNRAAIYRLIQKEAGISTKDIAERLELAWGTVTHHLTKLEKRRFVVSKKYGKYRRYFANGEGGTEHKDAVAVLRLDRTGDIAALIRQQPGLTQKAVSQALGVSSSTILWHVKRLEDVRLIRKVREGKLVRYFPADGAAGATIITPPAGPSVA